VNVYPIDVRIDEQLREARRAAAESTLDAISAIESQLTQLAVALSLMRQLRQRISS
jgi:hypothetical protein